MKFSAALSVLLLWGGICACPAFEAFGRHYAELLSKHAGSNGVRYAALLKEKSRLAGVLEEASKIAEKDFQNGTESEQLAFLLNLYNAATLQLITEHYPVESIRKIGGLFGNPWKKETFSLWGARRTLDWLEHEIIRVRYKEPRIHFALVCAARGCPPLRSEPYDGNKLGNQLDDQARSFLAQQEKNRIDPQTRTIRLSPIFDWYGKDFEAEAGSVQNYVRKFFNPGEASQLKGAPWRIQYTSYDWSLNDSSAGAASRR